MKARSSVGKIWSYEEKTEPKKEEKLEVNWTTKKLPQLTFDDVMKQELELKSEMKRKRKLRVVFILDD